MLTPKFEINQVFYTAVKWANQPKDVFSYCPCATVITAVTIKKKEVVYTVEQKVYERDGSVYEFHDKIVDEKELEDQYNSIHEVLEIINKKLENKFQELTKEINKNRLKEVLNA